MLIINHQSLFVRDNDHLNAENHSAQDTRKWSNQSKPFTIKNHHNWSNQNYLPWFAFHLPSKTITNHGLKIWNPLESQHDGTPGPRVQLVGRWQHSPQRAMFDHPIWWAHNMQLGFEHDWGKPYWTQTWLTILLLIMGFKPLAIRLNVWVW